ncbi:MAG: 30S ribosomal protein S17 [candidate division WOR-3 bacterium]|nr:30S ribosomal protein S17 [candidate division WOR-3 bacterium]
MSIKKRGRVVSNAPDKTIVVEVSSRVQHPLYKKYITKKKKFYAQDENNEASVGDLVQIASSRPISKLKRWRLDKIIEKGKEER